MDAIRVLDCGAGLCLAHRGGVFLTLLRRPIAEGHVERIRRLVTALRAEMPAQISALVILEGEALGKPPAPSVRAGLDALRRELPPYAAAIVVEGEGLRLAAVRLVLAGILAAAGAGKTVRSFDRARPAASFLAGILAPGDASASASLMELVAAARARLDATI